MRIKRLDLLSYGHLRDRSLDLASPSAGLVVVVGPNEAGKSTTMRALDALLFGVERTNGDHFGLGRASLRIGASLSSSDGTSLEVVRQGLNAAPLVDAAGEAIVEGVMLEMIGHTDRSLFRTLFRVDHEELTNGSAALLETDGEIGRLVFGASLGSVALTGVLGDLDARAAKLFRSGAKSTAAHDALLRHRRLAKEARDKRIKPRAWDDLDRRRNAAEMAIISLQERQKNLRSDESRLGRISSALPILTQRSQLELELAELRNSGPVQPRAWADEVSRLLDEQADSGKRRTRADEQHRGVVQQLALVDVDDELLGDGQRIGRLVEGTGRYRKDRKDLPKLEELLKGHQRDIDELLIRLGAEPGDKANKLVALTDAQREAIERLAGQRAQLDTDLNAAQTEMLELDRKITEAADRLADLHEPPDTASLSHALDAAKSLGPIEEQLGKTMATREQLDGSAQALALRLGFEGKPLTDVEMISVPPRTRVERERTTRADLLASRNALESDVARFEDERRLLTEEQAALETEIELPDHSALESAREHRDTGWQLVRASLEGGADSDAVASWAPDEPLSDAYENSVRNADTVADRRYEHAEQLTNLARNGIRLQQVDTDLAESAVAKQALTEREETVEQEWAKVWAHLGTLPSHPEDALVWLDQHKTLLDSLEKRREAENEIMRLSTQIEGHEGLMRDALGTLGRGPETGGLSVLIRQSDEVLDELSQHRATRDLAVLTLTSLRAEHPNRLTKLATAREDLEAWSAEWSVALEAVSLDPQAAPEAARITVQLVRDLRKMRDDETKDGGRLVGLQADVADYEADAQVAIDALAPDLLGIDLADAVSTVNQRLDHAKTNEARRQELNRQAEALAIEINDARRAEEDAASDLGARRASALLEPDTDLAAVVARSLDMANRLEDVAELEKTLIAQGGGRSVEQIEKEAAAFEMDGDLVGAELKRVGDELDEVELELGDAQSTRGGIRKELAEIDGSSLAADLDQQAEEALAETAQLLDEYTRVVLASALLKRVVSAYGAEHQRPILDDATRVFRSLTMGAFEELIVDTEGAKQVLLAKRRNGELLHTSELSSGTRDQLYLALRLAGVRHQLARAEEPMPLILDDLLVNFDDERSATALEVLADLGEDTQVLMFTHETSLAELAMETLGPSRCAVVRLDARDHDAPQIVTSAPKSRASWTPDTTGTEYQDRVLQCLRLSAEPLGKSTLLERAGLPDSEWQGTIKALIDGGLVEQHGQKRGAKYLAIR